MHHHTIKSNTNLKSNNISDFIFWEAVVPFVLNLAGFGGIFSLLLAKQYGHAYSIQKISHITYYVMASFFIICFVLYIICFVLYSFNIKKEKNQQRMLSVSMPIYVFICFALAPTYLMLSKPRQEQNLLFWLLCAMVFFILWYGFKIPFLKKGKDNYLEYLKQCPQVSLAKFPSSSNFVRTFVSFLFIVMELIGVFALFCNTRKMLSLNDHSIMMKTFLSVALVGVLGIAIQIIYYAKKDEFISCFTSKLNISNDICTFRISCCRAN